MATKKELSNNVIAEVMSHGGHIFSGHRNCPGRKLAPGLEKALNEWNGNWYHIIDRVYGPSSWSVDISVRQGKVFADGVEIPQGDPAPRGMEAYYLK